MRQVGSLRWRGCDHPEVAMIRPSEHQCGETAVCIDCETFCCLACGARRHDLETPGGRVVIQCNRCGDAEETDQEEMP